MHPSISLNIKSSIAGIFNLSGYIYLRLKSLKPDKCVVLMYHRVLPANRIQENIQAGMVVRPESFEKHIRFLKKYFHILSLSELIAFTENNFTGTSRPLCFITFDDGWWDFYQHAYPVLKKYNAPATVFLPTGFIGSHKWFWTDRLGFLLLSLRQQGRLNEIQNTYLKNVLKKSTGYYNQLEYSIKLLKTLPQEKIDEILSDMENWADPETMPSDRAFLNWEEINKLFNSGIITFGGHTVHHKILTNLPPEHVETEIEQCKQELLKRNIVEPDQLSFAYPNGNYDSGIVDIVKKAGYKIAFITGGGWNNQKTDRFTLKRISIHQDVTASAGMFGCRILEIF